MNTVKLNDFLNKKGISKLDVAKALNKDKTTIYRKLARETNAFSVEEALILKKAFNIPNREFKDIFFS